MSSWNSEAQQVVRWKPKWNPSYPGWLIADCGCCAGIEWSTGYEARECRTCGGGGWIHIHVKSMRIALWPGGPFSGRVDQRSIDYYLTQLNG